MRRAFLLGGCCVAVLAAAAVFFALRRAETFVDRAMRSGAA